MFSKLSVLVLIGFSIVSCSSNNTEEIVDKTNSAQGEQVGYPKALGQWIEARTFLIGQNEDEQQCEQVDFRVTADAGVYSVNECENTKTGQLTSTEFSRLDSLATNAYLKTEGAVCPEIFRFDKFYATINSTNDEFDRNFDPDSSCYRGSEEVVKAYKAYLRQLLDKYRGLSENG